MNPTVGHLYHDFSISNTFTCLDAKEKLRTRQINAREEKQLHKYSKVLDRAMRVCKRRHEYEEAKMKQQLQAIKSKTTSLDRGLRLETDRLKRHGTVTGSCSLPSIALSRATTTTNATGYTGAFFRSKTIDTPFSVGTSQTESSKSPQNHSLYHGSTKYRNTENRNDAHTANFCKRAEHVTRNLHKLYRRQGERVTSQKHLIDILRADNMELLMKARVFFKGTEAEAVLESLLVGRQLEPETNIVSFENDIVETGTNVPESGNLDQSSNARNGDSIFNSLESNGKKIDTKRLEQATSATDSGPVSSTIANPSVGNFQLLRTRTKWREIFKTPELWRLHAQKMKERNSKKQKSSSLVTITAKYRRTMVK